MTEHQGRGRPRTQPCGTPAAARRHRRRGEPMCDACRAAYRAEMAEQQRRWRARRKDDEGGP